MSEPLRTITVNDELNQAVNSALSPEAIRAAIIAEATKQGDAATQEALAKAATDQAAAVAAAAAKTAADATGFSRVETIGGREFNFEASNELELERMVANAYRVAYAIQPTEVAAPVVPVDPAIAQKAAEDAAAAKADLELKFKRGEISASDYIEQSGAVDEYLTKKGIPVDALKDVVEQRQNSKVEQSWADATAAFLQSPSGADWPGGARNLEVIGLKIQSLTFVDANGQVRSLVDAPDKVAALAQAYASMKSSNMVFPGDQVETTTPSATEQAAATEKAAADKVIAEAAAVVAQRAAAAVKTPSTSSSLFGRSSGVAGSSAATVTPAAPKTDIPADATPAEIMDAWKKAQVAGGKNPNDEFISTFAGRKS